MSQRFINSVFPEAAYQQAKLYRENQRIQQQTMQQHRMQPQGMQQQMPHQVPSYYGQQQQGQYMGYGQQIFQQQPQHFAASGQGQNVQFMYQQQVPYGQAPLLRAPQHMAPSPAAPIPASAGSNRPTASRAVRGRRVGDIQIMATPVKDSAEAEASNTTKRKRATSGEPKPAKVQSGDRPTPKARKPRKEEPKMVHLPHNATPHQQAVIGFWSGLPRYDWQIEARSECPSARPDPAAAKSSSLAQSPSMSDTTVSPSSSVARSSPCFPVIIDLTDDNEEPPRPNKKVRTQKGFLLKPDPVEHAAMMAEVKEEEAKKAGKAEALAEIEKRKEAARLASEKAKEDAATAMVARKAELQRKYNADARARQKAKKEAEKAEKEKLEAEKEEKERLEKEKMDKGAGDAELEAPLEAEMTAGDNIIETPAPTPSTLTVADVGEGDIDAEFAIIWGAMEEVVEETAVEEVIVDENNAQALSADLFGDMDSVLAAGAALIAPVASVASYYNAEVDEYESCEE